MTLFPSCRRARSRAPTRSFRSVASRITQAARLCLSSGNTVSNTNFCLDRCKNTHECPNSLFERTSTLCDCQVESSDTWTPVVHEPRSFTYAREAKSVTRRRIRMFSKETHRQRRQNLRGSNNTDIGKPPLRSGER